MGGQLVGCTVVRMLGWVRLVPRVDNVSTPTEVTWGVLKGPDTMDTADLLPDTNPSDDWMAYGFLREENVRTTTTITSIGHDPVGTQWFDLRSRRKVGEVGDTLWFAAENGGANTVTVQWYFRILVLLH